MDQRERKNTDKGIKSLLLTKTKSKDKADQNMNEFKKHVKEKCLEGNFKDFVKYAKQELNMNLRERDTSEEDNMFSLGDF